MTMARITSLMPGHSPPQLTMPQRTLPGSKKVSRRGPATSSDGGSIPCSVHRFNSPVVPGYSTWSSSVTKRTPSIGEGNRQGPSRSMVKSGGESGMCLDGRHRRAGRSEVVRGLLDAVRHRRLRERHVGARVVGFLVANVAVDAQHAVVTLEEVPGDRAGEGVLHIRVDVHLHDAVIQRLVNVAQFRTRAAVEHEVEAGRLAERLDYRILAILQDRRSQLDGSRFVHAVDIAERGGEQVSSALDCIETAGDFQRVLGSGV